MWSDSMSPAWFCGDGVKYRAVPASVLIHCDTVTSVRISPGHSLGANKVWPTLINSQEEIRKHSTGKIQRPIKALLCILNKLPWECCKQREIFFLEKQQGEKEGEPVSGFS